MKIVSLLIASLVVTLGYTQAPDTLWTKTYGGAENDVANSIQHVSEGGYIIAGSTDSFNDWSEVWVLRIDSLGDTLWTRTYVENYSNLFARAIQQTTDNGYVVVGTKHDGSRPHIWVLKIDENGNALWTKTFSTGWQGLRGSDIIQTCDNGYLIAGTLYLHYQVWFVVIRTDSLGNALWTTCPHFGFGSAVQETADGNYVIAGTYHDPMFDYSAFTLTKINPDGGMLWCKQYVDSLGYSYGFDVLETDDSCLTACGIWNEAICLLRADANGDTLWTECYELGNGRSLDATFDGGYIIVGEASEDAVFIKTDAMGKAVWTAFYGGDEYDNAASVLQASDDGYITVGATGSFGAGGSDVWIIKTEPDVGVVEGKKNIVKQHSLTTTIFRGPLRLPEGENCKVFDITGRVGEPTKMKPGVYFVEVDGVVTQKVIKIR